MMLLTSKQYKFIQELYQKVIDQIRFSQDDEKAKWLAIPQSEHDALSRGIHVGKQSAYEELYHYIRKQVDSSYKMEFKGADMKIVLIVDQIKAQALAIREFSNRAESDELRNLLADQANLLDQNAKAIENVLGAAGTDITFTNCECKQLPP